MKTRISGRLHNSERHQLFQVRQPAVRLRGSIAVYVASIAAPTPHASGSGSNSFALPGVSEQLHPQRDPTDAALDTAPSLSTPEAGGDAASLSSEHAAKLERAASSGLATTSSGVAASTSFTRRRFSGTAGKSTTPSATPQSRPWVSRGAPTFVRDSEFQPREFTSQLSAAASVKQLQQLFETGRKHDINAIHIATAWTRLAKLASGPPPRRVDGAGSGPADPRSAPRLLASPAAAQLQDPAELLAFVDALEAATTAEQLADMAPRGLSNVVWAAAKLKPAGPGLAGPGNADDSILSSGRGGGGESTAMVAEGEAAASASSAAEAQAEDEAVAGSSEAAAAEARPRPLRIRGGKTALAAAAAAAAKKLEAELAGRLSSTVVSVALLDAWAVAAGRKLSGFNMQDISNVVWALGRLGYQPRGLFMTQLSIAVLKELPRADRPQQVSNVLLGLALLRYTPAIKDFWPPVWEAVQRLVLAEQREPDVQGVTNTLWALSQLLTECPNTMPAVPSALVSKAVFRAVQYGERLSSAQCQDVFVALPRLGFEPSEYQSSKLLSLALRLMPSCDGQALSTIMTALVAMRVQPWRAWKAAARVAFQTQIQSTSPEAMARFLFAWGHMHEPPPVWTPQVWAKLHLEVNRLSATDIAFVVLGANQMFPRLPRRAKDTDAAEKGTDTPPPLQQQQQPPHQQGDAAPPAEQAQQEQAEAKLSPSPSSLSSAADASGASPAAAAAGRRFRGAAALDGGVKARLPSRQFMLALRARWEAVGAEAQLSVVAPYRALVQGVFDKLEA